MRRCLFGFYIFSVAFDVIIKFVLITSVADPGSGIRCLFDPWIRDPGWVKSGSGIRDKNPGSATLLITSKAVLRLAGKILGPDLPRGPCNVSCQSDSVTFRLPKPPGRHRSATAGCFRQRPGRYRSAAICLRQQPGCP
jgi:hypothetical protein